MLGFAAVGVVFIAAVVSIVLLFSFTGHDNRTVPLPEAQAEPETPDNPAPDALIRVEVTRETVQAVVSTLARPAAYQRNLTIESFWEGGHAVYSVVVSVSEGVTALRVAPSVGSEKRIIITPDMIYIWYSGDRFPYSASIGSERDGSRYADEWQMLVSYEDLLHLSANDIIEAGYIEYGNEYCVYASCLATLPGYTRRYYIPISLGLLTGAEEYDERGNLVYSMTAGECAIGIDDPLAFILPDGTNVLFPEPEEP